MPDERDVPPGPRRDLVMAAHELYRAAGWPSTRGMAADLQAGDFPGTMNHEMVSKFLRGRTLSTLPPVRSLAMLLAERCTPPRDPQQESARIGELWQGAMAAAPRLPRPRLDDPDAEGQSPSVALADTSIPAPAERDMAVARLKRALPDPVRRIELSDLIDQATARVVGLATPDRYPLWLNSISFEDSMRGYRADADTLLYLLAVGAFYDDGTYAAQWVKTVQRLSRIRSDVSASHDALEAMRHYPALLVTWTAGVAAVLARREELLAQLLTEPTWISPGPTRKPLPAANYLAPFQILDDRLLHQFFRAPNGDKWRFSQSRKVRDDAREPLRALEPDDATYEAACNRLEFLASMISFDNTANLDSPLPWYGEFLTRGFTELAEQIKDEIAPGWPLVEAGAFGGDVDRARTAHTTMLAWRAGNPISQF